MNKIKQIAVVFMFGAASAYGAAIAIANPSFESVTGDAGTLGCTTGGNLTPGFYIDNVTNFGQSNGCVTSQPLTGWMLTGSDGGASGLGIAPYFPGGLPDGNVAAFTQGNVVIGQTLGSILQAGEYTFDIFVGSRMDAYQLTGYTVELLAGSTVIGSSHNHVAPAPGQFLQDSLVVDIDSANPLLGQALGIALSSEGPGEGIFDSASLDFAPSAVSATPEPSTLLMGGLVLTALGVLRRRRC